MFKKILIANRGEIACRVIKTARRMGIQTVAVYSDADARAPFVQMADEAVHIGPSAASESYLIADKIIAAAKQTGAEGLLGQRGQAVSEVSPEGWVIVQGERWRARAEERIAAGEAVEVLSVEGRLLRVRKGA